MRRLMAMAGRGRNLKPAPQQPEAALIWRDYFCAATIRVKLVPFLDMHDSIRFFKLLKL